MFILSPNLLLNLLFIIESWVLYWSTSSRCRASAGNSFTWLTELTTAVIHFSFSLKSMRLYWLNCPPDSAVHSALSTYVVFLQKSPEDLQCFLSYSAVFIPRLHYPNGDCISAGPFNVWTSPRGGFLLRKWMCFYLLWLILLMTGSVFTVKHNTSSRAGGFLQRLFINRRRRRLNYSLHLILCSVRSRISSDIALHWKSISLFALYLLDGADRKQHCCSADMTMKISLLNKDIYFNSLFRNLSWSSNHYSDFWRIVMLETQLYITAIHYIEH